MIKKTTHYELSKPDYNETADIEVINSNMDIIDGALHELKGDIIDLYSDSKIKLNLTDGAGVDENNRIVGNVEIDTDKNDYLDPDVQELLGREKTVVVECN